MTANRLRALPRWACECKRCGHEWESTGAKPPGRCAGCTSRYWQTEAGLVPLGRPKAQARKVKGRTKRAK